MLRVLRPIFGWIGIALVAFAIYITLFGNANQVAATQALSIGVAALGCFKASEFFADKEK